jgi:hypothetical protein
LIAAASAVVSELKDFSVELDVRASDIFVSVGNDGILFVEPSAVTVKVYFLFLVRLLTSVWTVVAPTFTVWLAPPFGDVAMTL